MAFTCTKNLTKSRNGWRYVSIALFAITLLFTSCDSFLESESIKQEIQQHIAYANAPSYKILVQANDEDGTIKKPITGELTQKVTDTFEIKFAPAQDHEFVRWEASSVDLPQGESIYDYISFEDASDPETKVTFKKPLKSIVITAFCPPLPYLTFLLTGSRYGKYSPLKGTYTCIQTYSYPLSFEPDDEYEFIRWQIYDSKTGIEIPNGEYLKIDNPSESSTTFSLAAVPVNSDISLAIKPVITERPQIISRSPIDYGQSFYKDSRIQILFDHEMDEASIYYTKDELDDLIAEEIADSGLFPEQRNGKTVYFGYEKNGITYFKNILIKNYNGNEILNKCFDYPVFITPNLLLITANRSPEVPDFALVQISLEKDLSYKVDGKLINMPKSEKWTYHVTSSTDDKAPDISSKAQVIGNGKELPTYTDTTSETWKNTDFNFKNDLKLKFHFEIEDNGCGPASQFAIERTRILDENYNSCTETSETFYIDFQTTDTKNAAYDNSKDSDTPVTLPKVNKDGVYSVRFKFFDKSNNPGYFENTYYYIVDETPPALKDVNATAFGLDTTFSWNTDAKDFKKATIYSKRINYSNSFCPNPANELSKEITISPFYGDSIYAYYLVSEDYAGNIITSPTYSKFVPGVSYIKNSSYDIYGNITISWYDPKEPCDSYEVTYTYNRNTKTETVTGTSLTFPAAETNSIQEIPFTITATKGNETGPSSSFSTYSSFNPVVEKHEETSGGNHSGGGVSLIITYDYIKIKSPENSQGFTYNIRYSNSSSNSNPYYSTNFNFDQDILVKEVSTYNYYYFKVRAEKAGKEVWSKRINVLDYWPQ